MTRAEAHTAFTVGRLHPICPRCEGGRLRTLPRLIPRRDGNYWRSYQCVKCGERFLATVVAGDPC